MEFVNKVIDGIFGGKTETTVTTGEEVTTIVTEKTAKEKVSDVLDVVAKVKDVFGKTETTTTPKTPETPKDPEPTVKEENKKTLFMVGGTVALIVIALIFFKIKK